jgi:glutamate-1-semialdehyde aminotransferase
MNWLKACEIIPDGVQTLSKMPSKHVDGVYPKYITKGDGAYVWGDNNIKLIDYPCGLGSILLGYNNPTVNRAVIDQLEKPTVNRAVIDQLEKGTIFSLPNYLETELAERIVDIVPSAEMVRFLKTGSEATSAAVKIARAYTGKGGVICVGYHGWHDWYSFTTSKKKGVPGQPVLQCKYNDIETVIGAFEYQDDKSVGIAAVIMEPYILEEPKQEYLRKIRKLCNRYGAVLIFDEIVTGFRTLGWTAQKYFDITPDLTCLGKAMANGLPISCVCGKKELMKELQGDCFVSSTFGGELLSIAAALATIKIVEEQGVIRQIWQMGDRFIESFKVLVNSMSLMDGVSIIGYPPRTFFKFETEAHKSLFWQECFKKGVLFGYAQFINWSHGIGEIDQTIMAMRHALGMVRKYWEHPLDALEGAVAEETFRLVVEKEKK